MDILRNGLIIVTHVTLVVGVLELIFNKKIHEFLFVKEETE